MKRAPFLITTVLVFINIFLRSIYLIYGYISSEEGILIYGQKLAYKGLLPFIHYNAWNSLLNNYIVGFYQIFISPTVISQRIVALIISLIVFFLVLYICKNLKKTFYFPFAAFLLTFGSFTYLYYSTIPTSEQTMTLSLLVALALLSKTVGKKDTLFLDLGAFIFAILAFPIRAQALPATVLIWAYLFIKYRRKKRQFYVLSLGGMFFLSLVYLPFMLSGWDNFVYSIIWPFKAYEILVYQVGFARMQWLLFFPFFINIFKEYLILFIFIIGIFITQLLYLKQTIKKLKDDEYVRFIFLSFLIGLALASVSILHKPPYSTYIYPSVPILTYVCVFYLAQLFDTIKASRMKPVRIFLYACTIILAIGYTMIFPHTDYMKTSLATITKPPYLQLKEIHQYIETKTPEGSEILSFYIPAVSELNRVIPIDLNEGEGSISILSNSESRKYHLTNVTMLRDYINSKKAIAVVISTITPRFFGINEFEKQSVMNALTNNYILDKSFTNFSQIGNPRVSTLYIYLLKP